MNKLQVRTSCNISLAVHHGSGYIICMNQIIMVLMDRDGFTYDEAMDALQDARQAVLEGDDPEQVLYEHFELEPDYVHELL